VSGEDLLTRLLHLSVFTADDLAELAHSDIPEVRIGAAANLTDQALLSEVATKDADWRARKAAVENLTDQAVLTKVARQDKAWQVRCSAVKRVIDQAVLAKVAAKDKELLVRAAARERLAWIQRDVR
jgi:hypothetical protein